MARRRGGRLCQTGGKKVHGSTSSLVHCIDSLTHEPLNASKRMNEVKVRWAQDGDIPSVKRLADDKRAALGFVVWASLEERVRHRGLFVGECQDEVVGFVCFHHRRDGWTTIRELCVAEPHRCRGIGPALVAAVQDDALRVGQEGIRLKCPLDLPANGFYAQLGFTRVALEEGKRRPLAVWEKRLPQSAERDFSPCNPRFFLTLTHEASEIRRIVRLWDEAGVPRDPFAQVILSPLFASPATVATIHHLKDSRGSLVMFDSGGYQVQMGKASFEGLFDRLRRFYYENDWADWFVLPDHVPRSPDSDREVEFKVRESLDFAQLFLRVMPDGFTERALGVVHGRTEERVRRCVEAYDKMGVRYIGFGSLGTAGPNGTVNLVSQKSLRLLQLVQTLARERGLRLHIFGIGSPSHLIRLQQAGIIPHSFDSAGWWKAGGFGNIFFPAGRQLHITAVPTAEATLSGIEWQKRRSGHECPFCGCRSTFSRT